MNAPAPATMQKPAADILRLLVTGKTAQQAADLTGWPKHRVVVLIQSTDGWRYDPDRDTAYQAGTRGMVPRLPDGVSPTAPGIPDRPKAPDTIDTLLGEAAAIDDKTIQRELAKVLEGISRLREAVKTATERRQVERSIADLERQLADARERAKSLGARRKTAATPAAPADGPTTKEIRTWAAEQGVDCPARGKIPTHVRAAFDARGDQ